MLTSSVGKAARRKGAIVAVAHTIVEIAFGLITRQETCEFGTNDFDKRNKEAVKRRSLRRLEQSGKSN